VKNSSKKKFDIDRVAENGNGRRDTSAAKILKRNKIIYI
jgi:hypothetical protein